jgi:hypothetical protein
VATITKGENPVKPYTVKWCVTSPGQGGSQVKMRQKERSFRTRREAQDFKITVKHGQRTGTAPGVCQCPGSNWTGSVMGPLMPKSGFQGAGPVRRMLGIRLAMTVRATASSALARCTPRQ